MCEGEFTRLKNRGYAGTKVLTYVNFEGISNSDIRKIFGLGEKEKAKASRLLTSAVEGGYIKVMDPDTAPRYKKYIPYWA